jgi:O-antigen/teichoic acid export membrane protein
MNVVPLLPKEIQNLINRHPKFSLVMKGLSYLVSERLLKILIGFFVHAYIARHLGPDHFGKLTYIVKIVNVFYSFGVFGVDELIVKHLLSGKYAENDIFKTVLRLRLQMSLLGFIALVVFLIVFQPESYAFSLLVFIYGINIFIQSFNVFDLKFHARMNFSPLFWANNIAYFTASALRVFGVWCGKGISFFLATYIVGEIILKTLVLRTFSFKGLIAASSIKDLRVDIFRTSWPYFLSSFILVFDQRVSFFFIEKFLSLNDLGNYSVAVTLVDLWGFLPLAIAAVVFPSIVSSFNENKSSYQSRIQYLADTLVWISFLFCIVTFLGSNLIVTLLYGERYSMAGSVLALYSLTAIPAFFNISRIKWLTLENKLKDWLIINLFCISLNIISHYFFVKVYGIQGAIYSYLGSQLIGNVVAAIFLDSARKSLIIFMKALVFPYRLLRKV